MRVCYCHVNVVLLPSASLKHSHLPCSSPWVARVAEAKDNFLTLFGFYGLMHPQHMRLRFVARSRSSLSI